MYVKHSLTERSNQDSNKKEIHSPLLSMISTQLSCLQTWALVNRCCYGLWTRSNLWLRYTSLPFSFSLHSYDTSNYRQTNRELQCKRYLLMYFLMRANNQMQTYTSNIKLGPETQNTRISVPWSNGLAWPPAAFLHTKYRALEMYIPWAKPHTGHRHSGCSAHTHKQRPVQAPCGSESMWEVAAPRTDAG